MKKLFSKFFYSIERDFQENFLKVAIIVSLLAVVYLLSENIFLSFVVAAAATVVLLGWDGRIFFGLGLIFLVFCPFLLAFSKKSLAEDMAVYAYYMLALGVLLQMVEYVQQTLKAPKSVRVGAKSESGISKKQFLLFSLGVGLFALVFSGSASYFFYTKTNQKLLEQSKQLEALVASQSSLTAVESKSEGKKPLPKVVPVVIPEPKQTDWETVSVSIFDGSGEDNLGNEVAQRMGDLGVLTIEQSTTSPSGVTLVEYCSTCLNVAQELLSTVPNPETLFFVEVEDLNDEIVVRLGVDQQKNTEETSLTEA